jgi:hypothetical protein
MMCEMPVESAGGVAKVMPKTLFSSSFSIESNWAPVLICRNSLARVFISGIWRSVISSKSIIDMECDLAVVPNDRSHAWDE